MNINIQQASLLVEILGDYQVGITEMCKFPKNFKIPCT
jgi:hypothetical protein